MTTKLDPYSAAMSFLKLVDVITKGGPVKDGEEQYLTTTTLKWFLQIAQELQIFDCEVEGKYVNVDGRLQYEITPKNESARKVKDFLLQCELDMELVKG